MRECKTDLAAAMLLRKEGRLEEFMRREEEISRGGRLRRQELDDLYSEFDINVRRPAARCSCQCGYPPNLPGGPPWIYRGVPV